MNGIFDFFSQGNLSPQVAKSGGVNREKEEKRSKVSEEEEEEEDRSEVFCSWVDLRRKGEDPDIYPPLPPTYLLSSDLTDYSMSPYFP